MFGPKSGSVSGGGGGRPPRKPVEKSAIGYPQLAEHTLIEDLRNQIHLLQNQVEALRNSLQQQNAASQAEIQRLRANIDSLTALVEALNEQMRRQREHCDEEKQRLREQIRGSIEVQQAPSSIHSADSFPRSVSGESYYQQSSQQRY